ncbi:transmembrane amino acid transporter protein-domain-containing protein [Aspergillus pseudoustus]|uniref:Transmembrane amino acid transporter protein-domain-containing protein n=1 Tax=Aspergillus pseudoustus TaxID=1810923 RepID=A0ABR4INF6_9EURO
MSDADKISVEKGPSGTDTPVSSGVMQELHAAENDFEVFKRSDDLVDFRTVSWIRASLIYMKTIFALGVLSIPLACAQIGAAPAAILVVAFGGLATYHAIVLGNFRNNHPRCHSMADMAGVVGGPILREFVGGMFVIFWVLGTGIGISGSTVAFNALSNHATCTVWWGFIAAVVVIALGSVRKYQHISWVTTLGFASVFTGVFIVVIGVTTTDRPAAAPQEGPFELGYYAVAPSVSFSTGMSATLTIFASTGGSSAFLPVISEMKRPKDYPKAVYLCMAIVNAAYLAFSLVVYRWCGTWVASPSLGSAGETLKKVSFGVALAGLLITPGLSLHGAAKYLFVRIMRNSPHFQTNTVTHWAVWLSCTIGLGIVSFIIYEAVPIFNYLLTLTSAICCAPLAIVFPVVFWMYDHKSWRTGGDGQNVLKMAWYYTMIVIGIVGMYICVAGTYVVVVQINDAYRDGTITGAFTCADNSSS